MHRADLLRAIEYDDENVMIDVLYETPCCREVRLVMQRHQVLRDHESIFPLTLYVAQGAVQLEVLHETLILEAGDLYHLEAEVKHHLEALEDSVLRLTLFSGCAPAGEGGSA